MSVAGGLSRRPSSIAAGRAWSSVAAQGPAILVALLPGALTVYLGFRAGGYFIGATAATAAMLLALLAAHVMTVPRPAEGVSRSLALAVAALALFALWTLLSSRWSHAPERALVEFDRALLYALALGVFGAVAMDPRRLRWMVRGIALAALVICGAGLITRLLPDVWPTASSSITKRLSYPVTYWNALGLLAAIGITICVGLTSSEREPRLVRVLAAAATPVLTSTLVLTLSRGAFATAALGVLVFVVAGHPRALLAGLLATGPAAAIAILSTYDANLLVSDNPLTSAARDQGRDVAVVVALCVGGAALVRTLLLYVDDFVVRLRPNRVVRRRLMLGGAVVLAVGVVAAAVAFDAPDKYETFMTAGASEPAGRASEEARLTTVTDNGRIAMWTVAIDEFERHVLHGAGAGTYENSWYVRRPLPPGSEPRPVDLKNAHSLYTEVLGELGIIGLALLLAALVTIIVGLARRIRGADRALYATIFAAIVAWAVGVGFDWHWEMPATTLWVFALGGAAIARGRDPDPPSRFLGMLPRTGIAIVCCALVVFVPLRLIISEDRLESARAAYQERRCQEVSVFAGQSLDMVGSRPRPRELIAGCELRTGQATEAVSTMRAAVQRDPDSWRVHYSLAVAQARAGEDPRPEIRRARRLNPLDQFVRQIASVLENADGPKEWRRAARTLEILIPAV